MAASTVELQLHEILSDILSQSGASVLQSADDAASTLKFSELGVNSVDLMEFILRAEQQFDVDLLGNLTPNTLPETIIAWAAFIHDQRRVD